MSAQGFLNDFYRDLRDRRLLPVVIALGVAILAIPILLKSNAEAPPLPPAPAAIAEDQLAPAPAVLAGEEGVRDYRKRLRLLRSKNPFEAKFAPPAVSEGVGLEDVSETASDGSTSVTIEEPSSTSSSGSGEASSGVSSGSSSDTSSAESGGTTGGEETDVTVKEKEVLYAHRIDVTVGPKGDTKDREGVKELTALPGNANPVVIFAGVTEEGDRAVFMVSSDATETSGEGSCLPGAADCQFLTLGEGQKRELTYAPEGEAPVTYVLELTGIDLVAVKK